MSMFVKYSSGINFIHKVFFRNLITFSVISAVMRVKGIGITPELPVNLKYLVLRSMAGLCGVILYFYSIENLTLADSSMLNKLSPFFIIISAAFFLNEKIHISRIPLILSAFAGALMIIKPEFDLKILPALSGALSALFAGTAYTVIRFLNNREPPERIVFYFSGLSSLFLLLPSLLLFQHYGAVQIVFLLLIGVFATGGQYFLTLGFQSYRAGEVSVVTYSQILFSFIFGFLLFNELPDLYSISGGILIITSGVILYLKK